MTFALDLALFVLGMLLIAMLARAVLGFVMSIAHEWQPKGFVALLVESVFTATDWIVKPLRRLIPPISIGQLRLDVAFMIGFFSIIVMQYLVTALRAAIG